MLRWIAIVLAVAVAVPIAVAVTARLSDGPIGPFQGGPFREGRLFTEADVDWSFAAPLPTIELQLLDPPRARTVWLVVYEGDLYVPCGLPWFRLWKQWPHQAMRDGRALLRIGGTIYPRQAVRVENEGLIRALGSLTAEKYDLPEGGYGAEVWFFRMDPRAPQ